MRALFKMTWVEFKLFLREPIGAFFTLIFPLMLLFIFGSIFGNEPSELMGGLGSVDVSTPAYIAMIIGTVGLMSGPISLVVYREQGILRRFRAAPLRPVTIIGAQVIIYFLMTLLGVVLLVVAAHLVYHVRLPEAPLAVFAAFCLSLASFLAAGFVLASLMPTARTTQVVAMAIFYPMLFLSGAAGPRQIMPETVQKVSEFLPLTHVNILIGDLWFGEGWSLVSVAVLVGMLVIGGTVASRTFRWE
ncbi:MAG: ABC transporter permease [Anaerolineae bacterium]|nr:ABC transporter permease [Anaerolineae bacterium]